MLQIYTVDRRQLGSAAWEQDTTAAMPWTLHLELMVLDQAGKVSIHFFLDC